MKAILIKNGTLVTMDHKDSILRGDLRESVSLKVSQVGKVGWPPRNIGWSLSRINSESWSNLLIPND
jgi:hypothetical protein